MLPGGKRDHATPLLPDRPVLASQLIHHEPVADEELRHAVLAQIQGVDACLRHFQKALVHHRGGLFEFPFERRAVGRGGQRKPGRHAGLLRREFRKVRQCLDVWQSGVIRVGESCFGRGRRRGRAGRSPEILPQQRAFLVERHLDLARGRVVGKRQLACQRSDIRLCRQAVFLKQVRRERRARRRIRNGVEDQHLGDVADQIAAESQRAGGGQFPRQDRRTDQTAIVIERESLRRRIVIGLQNDETAARQERAPVGRAVAKLELSRAGELAEAKRWHVCLVR